MDEPSPRLVECPSCLGTTRNRWGGPCRRCRATGQIEEYGFYVPSALAWLGSVPAIVLRLVRRWLGSDPDTGLPRDREPPDHP